MPPPPIRHQVAAPTPSSTSTAVAGFSTPTNAAAVKRAVYSEYTTLPPAPMPMLTMSTPWPSSNPVAVTSATVPTTDAVKGVGGDMPDWPPLLAHFLLAWLFFAWVLAAVLYLSQVWGLWEGGWLRKLKRSRKLRKRAEEPENPKTLPSRAVDVGESEDMAASSSSAVATGLGISIPMTGLQPLTPRLRRPRSFEDEDSIRVGRPSSLLAPATNSFTAPLPSARSFLSLSSTNARSRDDRSSSNSDLESGLHTPVDPEQQARDLRCQPEDDGARGLAGFLESVNVAIEYAATKLVKATYDHVERPEEGLLLPIRDGERERPGEVLE